MAATPTDVTLPAVGMTKQAWILVSSLVLASPAAPAVAQGPPSPGAPTGEDIYRSACITCHGEDGAGGAPDLLGTVEPPDFSDCAFSTAEPDPDWAAVVHEGGPIRALDRHMPAFGDALSAEEIVLAVSHLRTFCAEPAWPRGDLNFPRSFFTEKAFPENEAVWTTAFARKGGASIGNELVYERRLGARSQVEVIAPIDFNHAAGGDWRRGLGDVALAFKRTVYASHLTGRIASAGMELILPTGKEDLGLGRGYTVFEPFAMWGQALPRGGFLQMHGGLEIPSDGTAGATEGFIRTAVGTTLAQDRGFGRAWSPQVELLWARAERGEAEWDLVPQVQITLSRLQHVMMSAGVRIPLTERAERPTQALVYLLWDWFDGSPFDFWK
jgi:mono/diheme cytochrome c family protein